MRTVTHHEIQESIDKINGMSEKDTHSFMKQMSEEQPYIQIYVAAICDRGDFENENDADAFVNLVSIIWCAMRMAAGGKIHQAADGEIDKREAQQMKLYTYTEGEPENGVSRLVESWMKDYNQRPMLEYVLEALMSPEHPHHATTKGSGLIFTYLKIIIDCLDNAKITI